MYEEIITSYLHELYGKYITDDLLKKKETHIESVEESAAENSVAIVEYKESIFTKIKNWFNGIFNK